jgi:hypothetical protein
MSAPEGWLWAAIEEAAECSAYPMSAPDTAAPPYVVFGRTATDRTNSLSGPADAPSGTFSVEIYSDGYKAGKDIADLVREALDNFTGSVETVTIIGATLTDENDGAPVLLDGRERPTYVIEHTYTIKWAE